MSGERNRRRGWYWPWLIIGFMALVVGMAVGSQRFMVAILGTVALVLVVLYLNLTSFGSLGRYDGYLTLRVGSRGDGPSEYPGLLHKFCRVFKEISTRHAGDDEEAEYVFQIGLRDRDRSNEMLNELRKLEGVTHASLVIRSELSEV